MKNLLIFLAILSFGISSAQDLSRKIISGEIVVPEGDLAEGITVFNKTSGRGTVSAEGGRFNIPVAVNDTLNFSAVQFQNFAVVIDEGVVDSGELNVFISPTINPLPEVVVTPYDLSGNVRVDIERIPVQEVDLPNETAAEINFHEWEFRPDEKTSPANAAMRMATLRDGVDFAGIFRNILNERVVNSYDLDDPELHEEVRQLYEDEFFQEHLDIKRENISEFIYYAEDNGLTEEMLEKENEMDLLRFLIDQSGEYKRVAEDE